MWGRSGEVYEPVMVDVKDPNYDEDQVMSATSLYYGRTVFIKNDHIYSGL